MWIEQEIDRDRLGYHIFFVFQVQGDNKSDLDFGAVQRGDAEMEQKLNRLVRACMEMGEKNPILSIHDQGAGGNGKMLKMTSIYCSKGNNKVLQFT